MVSIHWSTVSDPAGFPELELMDERARDAERVTRLVSLLLSMPTGILTCVPPNFVCST